MNTMTEYEQIRRMNHQEYLLTEKKASYRAPWKKWLKAKKLIKAAMEQLNDSENQLRLALKYAVEALTLKQAMDDNPPLKKIALDQMDGDPVWIVSSDHDGHWGIVNVSDQSVNFVEDGVAKKEYWFDGRYIFRYKKIIVDYSAELEKFGITDEECPNKS